MAGARVLPFLQTDKDQQLPGQFQGFRIGQLLLIAIKLRRAKDTTKHFRVQGFNTTAQG
jgi:hypothetical protein